jgi:DNA-binding XRE family transcriptional regulator
MDVNLRKGHPSSGVPIPVTRALRKLGHDIRDARRRRRIPVAVLAARASISRMTLNKIEKGDPGASLGAYATVLFALGMADRLADVADPRHDTVGLALEEENLPERIRFSRRRKPGKPESTVLK